MRIFLFLLVLQSSRCWIWVRIKPTRLILITTERDFLKNFCLKIRIAWGNSIDERWTHRLHMCATLAETVSLLQESIYTEAVNIFGHLKPKKRNLAGQSRWTKLSIQLNQQKNLQLYLNCLLALSAKLDLFTRQKRLESVIG